MPNYIASIAVDDVADALIAFLTPFVTPSVIVRAQGNRVSPPQGPFVLLTELRTVDIETPIVTNSNPVVSIEGRKRIDWQIDFYGPLSGDQCSAITSVFRTGYTVAQFPANISPLYLSDGIQSPLITGEEQYESRWTITASLQYDPIITVPAQFATALRIKNLEDIP
jgi:hypothetical protein